MMSNNPEFLDRSDAGLPDGGGNSAPADLRAFKTWQEEIQP